MHNSTKVNLCQEPSSSVALSALQYEENQGLNHPSPIVVTIEKS
jgi:hypothetical protein